MASRISVSICAGLLVLAPMVFATPPDSLKLTMDTTGTVLSVTVFHPTENPAAHFIKTLELKVNGKTMVFQTFIAQLNRQVQEGVYKLVGLKPADRIAATGTCNLFGDGTAVYVVPKTGPGR